MQFQFKFSFAKMDSKFYKCCAVPQCISTTIKTPEKLFIHVPRTENVRKKWLQLARRDPAVLATMSKMYFCEDHFDMPNDMENFMEYHIMGSVSQIRMKPDCLPSKFDCQLNRKHKSDKSQPTSPTDDKRQRICSIEESSIKDESFIKEESLKKEEPFVKEESFVEEEPFVKEVPFVKAEPFVKDEPFVKEESFIIEECFIKDEDQNQGLVIQRCDEHNEVPTGCSELQNKKTEVLKMNMGYQNKIDIKTEYRRKCAQTASIFLRSKQTSSIKIPNTSVYVKVEPSCSNLQNLHEECDLSNSDLSVYTLSLPQPCLSPSSSSHSLEAQSNNSSYDLDNKSKDEELSLSIIKATVDKIEKNPHFYIGVPKSCYFLLKIMNQFTGIPEQHILLCLKKIRLNNTFLELGDDFAITKSCAERLFKDSVPVIANFMRQFIVKLEEFAIKKSLPISFRHNFYNVSCIIHCLEIEIEKPSKAVHESVTWSEYKKANTLKYLISSTPNGLVNYVSPGYGGRISDACLLQNCGFLNCLPRGSSIIANKGFKDVENLFTQVGCLLVRLPSVEGSKLSKQIASQRIQIERVMHRLREFSMLKLHSCVNNQLNDTVDDIVVIACGLINLNKSLIKK